MASNGTSASSEVVILDYKDVVEGKDLKAEIAKAYGPGGSGICALRGVPGLEDCRKRLLPLAHKLAHLPKDVLESYERADAHYCVGWSHGREKFKGKPDMAKGSFYANPVWDDPAEGDEAVREKYPYAATRNIWPKETCNSKMLAGRLLHYFSPTPDNSTDDAWCGWHNDTRVLRVPLPSDCLGFQIGEAAQVLSGGALVATPHQVRSHQRREGERPICRESFAPPAIQVGGDRVDGALFIEPQWDAAIAPPKGVGYDSVLKPGAGGALSAADFASIKESFRLQLLQPPLSTGDEMERFWGPIALGRCSNSSEEMLQYLQTVQPSDVATAWSSVVMPQKVREKVVIKLFGTGVNITERPETKVQLPAALHARLARERANATVLPGEPRSKGSALQPS
eukprot:g31000.t1